MVLKGSGKEKENRQERNRILKVSIQQWNANNF